MVLFDFLYFFFFLPGLRRETTKDRNTLRIRPDARQRNPP